MKKINKIIAALSLILVLSTAFAVNGFAQYYLKGEIVSFGEYPSEAYYPDDDTKEEIEKIEKQWSSFGPDGAFKYCDFELSGIKIREVVTPEVLPDGYSSSVKADSNYYFKFSPIQWRLLDEKTGLMVCQSLIDVAPYGESSLWANSSARQFLNNDFYNVAFTDAEKKDIAKGFAGGDKVTLLSENEYNSTLKQYEWKESGNVHIAEVTKYCQSFYGDYAFNDVVPIMSVATILRSDNSTEPVKYVGTVTTKWDMTNMYSHEIKSLDDSLITKNVPLRPVIMLNSVLDPICPKHRNSDYHIETEAVSAPSCATEGVNIVSWICDEGGCVILTRQEGVPAPGHDFEVQNPSALSCKSSDAIKYKCKICGEIITDSNPLRTHSFGAYKSNNDATCIENGTKTKTCADCGEKFTVTDTGSKLAHNYTQKVVKASTTQSGKIYNECNDCKCIELVKELPKVSTAFPQGVKYYYIYTGKAITIPDIMSNNSSLVKGTDYDITYKNNINPGIATAAIKLKGNYEGEFNLTFKIYPKGPTNPTITFDGEKATISWTASFGADEYAVVMGKVDEEYTVYRGAKTSVALKLAVPNEYYTGYIVARDKDAGSNHEDDSVCHFAFRMPDLEFEKAVYTGKAITPGVTLKGANGKELTQDKDYTLSYSSNTAVGLAKTIIKLKNGYNTKIESVFRILPQKVKSLTPSAYKTNSLKLSWASVKGAERYDVYKSADGKTWTKLGGTTATSMDVSNLSSGQLLSFRVRAYASSGYGEYSSPLKTQTLTSAPSGIKQSAVSKTSIRLSWKAVVGASKYIVYGSTDNKTWKKMATVVSNSATISKLTAGKKYYFKLTSVGLGGESAKSAVFKTQTLTEPTTITLKSSEKGKVVVSLKKVEGASKYVIFKSTDGKKWTKVASTAKNTYTVTSLTPGKKIFIRAQVEGAYGSLSAVSASKSITVKK